LVLLSGGTFNMGSQKADAALPNHDPVALPDEIPVHEILLDPFFMGKYEVTQAQWRRFTGDVSAYWNPESLSTHITWTNPVEQVNWIASNRFAERQGLALPTEAQWEYACRGGTSMPYFCGETLSPTVGNMRDESYGRTFRNAADFERGVDDKFALHAPVGSLAPNAFGLFDTHGNVWEWCRDWFAAYAADDVEQGTGLHRVRGSRTRAIRGGAFDLKAVIARSAARRGNTPDIRSVTLGIRTSLQVHH